MFLGRLYFGLFYVFGACYFFLFVFWGGVVRRLLCADIDLFVCVARQQIVFASIEDLLECVRVLAADEVSQPRLSFSQPRLFFSQPRLFFGQPRLFLFPSLVQAWHGVLRDAPYCHTGPGIVQY